MAAPKEGATLSRELSEFLVEFSIGVHRYAMYPPGHPSLAPVVESIVGRLQDLLSGRPSLTIGVARRQLIIDGEATDQKHPVLSDLAEKLHHHQLGAMVFEKGLGAAELGELLHVVAEDTSREGVPLGLRPPEEFPTWQRAKLLPVGYEGLEMRGAGRGTASQDKAAQLWLALAQAAMASDRPLAEVPDGAQLARTIRDRGGESAYDEVIVGYLRQIAHELKEPESAEAREVRERVSSLVSNLDDETLNRLVAFRGDTARRERFLMDANQGLAVDAVLRMLQAAAASSEQTISTSMRRLLTKLAHHAETAGGQLAARADHALRENVERLIEDWRLTDPNPDAYTRALDAMASSAPAFQARREEESLSAAERLVQTALEIDAWGPLIERAVHDMTKQEGGAARLLELVAMAEQGSETAAHIHDELTDPEQFQALLVGEHVDEEGARALIESMGRDAIDPLLGALAQVDTRAVRRLVFDVLEGFGAEVGERAVARLEGADALTLRNMLGLLHRLPEIPEGFDPQPFLRHPDGRVRREALPIALARPGSRDRALVTALGDEDERMVRMGLMELGGGVPEQVLPTLVNRVVSSETRSSEVRATAARLLAGNRSPLALNALLGLVTSGRSIFGRAKLNTGGPEALSALRVLASDWAEKDEVQDVLKQASRSKDPEVRGAVRVGRADAAAREEAGP